MLIALTEYYHPKIIDVYDVFVLKKFEITNFHHL